MHFSDINLLVDESTCKMSWQDEFIWEYETNIDGAETTHTTIWKPYSTMISASIEDAYKRDLSEIDLDEDYRIDLKCHVQHHINTANERRRVRRRRCCLPLPDSIGEDEKKLSRRERFSSPLGVVVSCSCTADTTYYGSPFVYTWLMMFTKGKMNVTFDDIFPALVNGLIKEGKSDPKNQIFDIVAASMKVERDTEGQDSKARIKALQNCCAKLYTKNSYIYRVVNTALRDDDQTKLYTVGPFCYLLFNSIGQCSEINSSRINFFRRLFSPSKIQSIDLYRGDHNSSSTIEEYRRAVGDKSKRFKWLSFVSTSFDQSVAESFAGDVLYIIKIRSYVSNKDQLTNLAAMSHYEDEKEILLLPGVQFQVTKLEYDNEMGRHLVHIKINSSYISKLI